MRGSALLFLLLLVSSQLFAQGFNPGFEEKHPYPFRNFLNKFSLNLSAGYGRPFYRQEIDGFAYARTESGSYLIPAGNYSAGDRVSGYSQWFSGVEQTSGILLDEEYSLVNTDSIEAVLKSGGYGIPLNIAIYYNLQRLRIGGGINMEFHRANVPEPDDFLTPYPAPEPVNSLMTRWFGLLGYSVYEYYDNAFGVDVRFGKLNMGSGFDKEVIENDFFVNIGVSLEKVYSEYFRVYLRPSYEIKSFQVLLPDGTAAGSLPVSNNAFYITLGVSINYPDLPRSPIPNDNTQMKHYVSDTKGNRMLVRGQPIWKKQDPKIGELYPELQKSKRKRRGRNPFFDRKK